MNQKLLLSLALISTVAFVSILFGRKRPSDQSLDNNQHSYTIKPDKLKNRKPKIQIVFALDATGSMSGLIGAAKEKIWSIAGSLAQADPAPEIEMGLIFYRDRGDEFITRRIALSTDIDAVYAKLMQISAEGGGDLPESVNQALYESITKFAWDSSNQTYKTVFLVGDCPPHMDYRNDIKYPASCSLAKQKDIILNTILMGNDRDANRIWHEIANCSQGSFTQVNMNANDIVVNTPYDSVIAVLSDEVDDTRLYHGTKFEKSLSDVKLSMSKSVTVNSKPNVKAQRAEYNASKTGKVAYYGDREILEEYRMDKTSLETIKKEELPDEMKDLSPVQRKVFVEQKIVKRDSLMKELTKYSLLRQTYIEKDLSKRDSAEVNHSFSNQIYKNIRKQTEKKNIHLREKTKY
jgi:Mg-chelatase subunit ChlD